ncbi:MAG: hypothetical protein AAFQ53_13075 [Bacteroidota bacterium]
MTVAVAVRWNGVTALCADTATFQGHRIVEHRSKIHEVPVGWYSFAGSVACRQAAAPVFEALERLESAAHHRQLVTNLREALKAQGWNGTSDKGAPSHHGFSALLVLRSGQVVEIGCDLSLTVSPVEEQKIATIGYGAELASGAAYALIGAFPKTAPMGDQRPVAQRMAERAVEIACDRSAWCDAPGKSVVVAQEGSDA